MVEEGQICHITYRSQVLTFPKLHCFREKYYLVVYSLLVFFGTFLLNSFSLKAQTDSTMLDKHFKFQDGIYYSFTELRQNQPAISWEETKVKLYSNPQTYITRIDDLKIKISDSVFVDLSPDSLYGISLGGIPYLYIGRSEDDRFSMFAGLQVRGYLSYFAFEKTEEVTYDMPVYNPLTGKAFRTGRVKRKEKIPVERLFVFSTGEIYDFTLANFKKLIQKDAELTRALEVLSPEEAFDKMWKCMLIFDDRHPVYIKEGKRN